jgi:phosphoribosylformimino-5-aminoimidazole carboxamide ribotide isomerase
LVSRKPPKHFAELYREHNLRGGHVIKLGPGNDEAAKEALAAWPSQSSFWAKDVQQIG